MDGGKLVQILLGKFAFLSNSLLIQLPLFLLTAVPSPPTAPLEIRSLSANAAILEWGVPESDGGAPLEGYEVVMRDVKKTMWMQVGRTKVGVQKLTVKDLQVSQRFISRYKCLSKRFRSELKMYE